MQLNCIRLRINTKDESELKKEMKNVTKQALNVEIEIKTTGSKQYIIELESFKDKKAQKIQEVNNT